MRSRIALAVVSLAVLTQVVLAAPVVDQNAGTYTDGLRDSTGLLLSDSSLTFGVKHDPFARQVQLIPNMPSGQVATVFVTPTSFDGWGRVYLDYTASQLTGANPDLQASFYAYTDPSATPQIFPLTIVPSDDPAYDGMATIGANATFKTGRVVIKLAERVIVVGAPDPQNGESDDIRLRPTVNALKVTWSPRSLLRVGSDVGKDSCSGASTLYKVPVSVSLVRATGLVVWAPIPTALPDQFGKTYAASPDLISNNGTFVTTATTLSGVTIPANSIIWQLGDVDPGSTFTLSYALRFPTGILDLTKYRGTTFAVATNATQVSSLQSEITIHSNPSPLVYKSPTGTFFIGGRNYINGGQVLGFSITAENRWFGGSCQQNYQRAVIYDDVSDFVAPKEPGWAFGSVFTTPPGFTISDGGQFTSIQITVDGTVVPANSVYWQIGEIPVGTARSVSFSVTLKPDVKRGGNIPADHLIQDVAYLKSAHDPENGSWPVDVYVTIPDDPKGTYAKGDRIRGSGSVHVGEDNIGRSVTYGEPFQFLLTASDSGASALVNTWMFDRVPDSSLFVSAFLPASAQGTVYYNLTGATRAANDPPGVNANGSLDNTWSTAPPADPSTVKWVAFNIPRLASGYFPEPGFSSSVTAEITVVSPAQGEACPNVTVTNTAAYRTLSYVGVGQTTVQPTNQVGYATDSEMVDVRPVRPSFWSFPYQTVISPSIRNGTGNVDFVVTATNSDQFGNEVDTALDVAITLQLPKLKVNGVLGPLPFGGIDAPGGSVDLSGLPNTVVVRYPTIAPNTSRSIVVHSSVPRGFVSGDGYSISASLTSRDDLCGLVTASSSATGTVGGNPFLRVAKKTDLAVVAPATDVRYTLSYINTGDAVSTHTWIVDRVPAQTTFKLAQSLAGGGEIWFSDKGTPVLPTSLRDPSFRFDDAAVRANFQKGITLPSGSVIPPSGLGQVTWVAFLVDNATLSPPQLPIGEARTATYTVTVSPDAEGSIRNEAAVFADAHFPAISNEVLTVISPDPSIELQRICPDVVAAGETFTYTVDYVNNSTNQDYNVLLVETLDPNVTYLSADHTWNADAQVRVGGIDPQPQVAGQEVTFDIGTAIAGSGPLLSFEGGRVVYRVKADADLPSGSFLDLGGLATTSDASGELTTSLFGGCRVLVENADLFARKVVDQPAPVSGETVTYSILVSNEGANDADAVSVVDNLPVGITYVADSALVTTSGWKFSVNNNPTIATVGGAQRLTWNVAGNNALQKVGDVAGHFPGRSGDVTISFRAKLSASVPPATTLTNRVSVTTPSGEDPNQPNTGTVDVRTPLPDPYVIKTGQTFAQPGASITYRFRYGNESRQASGPVFLVDKLYDTAPANGAADVTYIGHTVPSQNGEKMYFNAASLTGAEPAFDPQNPGATGWTQTPSSLSEVRWVGLYAPSLPGSSGPFSAYLDVALRTPSSGLTPLPGASIQNCATIRQLNAVGDDDQTNNQGCVITRTPGIDVGISASCDPSGTFPGVVPGADATLSLTITNNGTVPAYGLRATWNPPSWFVPTDDDADTIVALDENGNSVLLLDATGAPITDAVSWTKSGHDFVIGSLTAGPRNYQRVALPAGASTTITIRGTVASNVANRTAVTQDVTVTTDYRFDYNPDLDDEEEILTNNAASCGTTVYRADPLVVKTATGGPYNAGERIRWTVSYQNAGDAPAKDMVIDDVLPENAPYVVGSFTNVPDGAELLFDDGSGTYDYVPNGADGDIDPNVKGIRLAWEGDVPAPANATFVQDSAQDFASGSFNRTQADGGKVVVNGSTGSTTGSYTSPVIPAADAGNVLEWTRLLVDATVAEDASLSIAVLDGATNEVLAEDLEPDESGAIAFDIDPAAHPTIKLRASLEGAGLTCDYTKDRVVPLATARPVPVESAALGCVDELVTGTTIEAIDGGARLNPLVWEHLADGSLVPTELPIPEGVLSAIGYGAFDRDLLMTLDNTGNQTMYTFARSGDGWKPARVNGRVYALDADHRLLLTLDDGRRPQIEFFDGDQWQASALEPQEYQPYQLIGGVVLGETQTADGISRPVVWRAVDLGFEAQVLDMPADAYDVQLTSAAVDGSAVIGYVYKEGGIVPLEWEWNGSSWKMLALPASMNGEQPYVITPDGTVLLGVAQPQTITVLRRQGAGWAQPQQLTVDGVNCEAYDFDPHRNAVFCSAKGAQGITRYIWRPTAAGPWAAKAFPVLPNLIDQGGTIGLRRDHAIGWLLDPEAGRYVAVVFAFGYSDTSPVSVHQLEMPEADIEQYYVGVSLVPNPDCQFVEAYGSTPSLRGFVWDVDGPDDGVTPVTVLGGPDRTTGYTSIVDAENDTLFGYSYPTLFNSGDESFDENETLTVWAPDLTGIEAHSVELPEHYSEPRTIGPGGEPITVAWDWTNQRPHSFSWVFDSEAGTYVPQPLPTPADASESYYTQVYHDTIGSGRGGYDTQEGALEGYQVFFRDGELQGEYGAWIYQPFSASHWVWLYDVLGSDTPYDGLDSVEWADGTVTIVGMYDSSIEDTIMLAIVRDGSGFDVSELHDIDGNPVNTVDAYRNGVIAAEDPNGQLIVYVPGEYATPIELGAFGGYTRAISGQPFGDTGLPLIAVHLYEEGDFVYAPTDDGYERVDVLPPDGFGYIELWDSSWPDNDQWGNFFDTGPAGFEQNIVGGNVYGELGETAAIVVPDDESLVWQSYVLPPTDPDGDDGEEDGNSTVNIVMVGEGPVLYGWESPINGSTHMVGYTFPDGDLSQPKAINIHPTEKGEWQYAEPYVPNQPAGATGAIAAGYGYTYDEFEDQTDYRALFFVPQGDGITTVVSTALRSFAGIESDFPAIMSTSTLVPVGHYDGNNFSGINAGLWGCASGGGVSLDRWEVVYRTDKNPSFGYELEVPDVCQSRITNTATLTTSSPEVTQSNDQSTASVPVQSAELRVTADVSDSTVLIGDSLFYNFTVENLGPGPATDVVIDVSAPDGFGTSGGQTQHEVIDVLQPGESVEYFFNLEVATEGMFVPFVGSVAVSASSIDCNPGDDDATASAITGNLPNVYVDVRGPEAPIAAASSSTWEIEVGNDGNADATNVVLTGTIPPGTSVLEIFASDESPCSAVGQTYTCTIGTLDGNSEAQPTYVTIVLDEAPCDAVGNMLRLTAHADTTLDIDQSDNDDFAEQQVVEAAGVMSLSIVPGFGAVEGGDRATYFVHYRNDGASVIPDASISVPLPVGATIISDSVSPGVAIAPGGLTFAVFDLEPGQSGSFSFTLQLASGTLSVTASAQGTDMCPVSATAEPLRVVPAGLLISKAASSAVGCDDPIDWLITVRNTSTAAIANVVVTDAVPTDAAYLSGTIKGRGANAAGAPVLVWQLGTVAAGEVVTLGYRSNAPASAGSTIANVAKLEVGGVVIAQTSSTLVRAECDAPLRLTKSWDAGCATTGQTVVVQLAYENPSRFTVTGVVVRDPLQPGVTPMTVEGGAVGQGAVQFNVGTLLPGQSGVLRYTATVSGAAGDGLFDSAQIIGSDVQPSVSNQVIGGVMVCDDGNPCTADTCALYVGCVHTLQPLVGVSDATCNGVDDDCDAVTDEDFVQQPTTCGLGVCENEGHTACPPGASSPSDTCSPLAKQLESDTTCNGVDEDCDGTNDDNYVGVTVTCGFGSCAGSDVTTCVDGEATDDCTPLGNGTACVDDDLCSDLSACLDGRCVATRYGACDDENDCTLDTCNPSSGCAHAAVDNGIDCDDDNACTSNDSCQEGACVGTAATCAEPDACHFDGECNPGTGVCDYALRPGDLPVPLRISDLGTLGGASSTAIAVNAAGLVVGTSDRPTGGAHAFAWTASGGMVDLTPAATASESLGVNDAGLVVGRMQSNGAKVFSWTAADGLAEVSATSDTARIVGPTPSGKVATSDATNIYYAADGRSSTTVTAPGTAPVVTAINDAGTMVGEVQVDGVTTAWRRVGTAMSTLPALGSGARAEALNASNVAVGWAVTGGVQHAALWQTDGTLVDLGTLDGGAASALAVDDTGRVYGHVVTADRTVAFTWTQASGMVDLGAGLDADVLFMRDQLALGTIESALGVTSPVVWSGTVATVLDVLGSDFGQPADAKNGAVVGTFDRATGTRAFFWTAARGTQDLGTLGGTTAAARGVSSAGLVVGHADLATGTSHAFVSTAPTTACIVCDGDEQAPVIVCPVAPRAVECTFGGNAITLGNPSVSDACGEPIGVSDDAPEVYDTGTTIVTFTATDSAENSAICTTAVSVVDTEAPTITCPPTMAVTADPGVCGADVTLTASAVDGCDGNEVTLLGPAGPLSESATLPPGETTVVITAVDRAGNTATCETVVTVGEVDALTIACDPELTVDAPADFCGYPEAISADVDDACNVGVTVESSNDEFPIGVTDVTFEAENDRGQSDSCVTRLTVRDVTPPAVLCGYEEDADPEAVPAVFVASASDACTATIVVSDLGCFDGSGDDVSERCDVRIDGNNVVVSNRPDDAEVRWKVTATDPSGNVTAVDCHTSPDTSGLDRDRDGVLDGDDNCIDDPNADQHDWDDDGIGDVCDPTPFDGLKAEGSGGCNGAGASGLVLVALALLAMRRRRLV